MLGKDIPDLSIIVPLFNDADELGALFDTLKSQYGVDFEIILSDGGSSCRQEQMVHGLASSCNFPVRYVRAKPGRGHQMNAGAAAALADTMLFLHADSRFADPSALSGGLESYKSRLQDGDGHLAARFALSFRRKESGPSLAYSFYEAKARLNRSDCIRGDQGFMLSRAFFGQLGGFDDTLPYLEDIRLAAAVESRGSWVLLPAVISTSARRFEVEGLFERQLVNGIIVNAVVVRWEELLSRIPGLYRSHAESGRLQLFVILDGIRLLLARKKPFRRCGFWFATGRHLSANIWQLFFWLDVRRAFASGKAPNLVGGRWSGFYRRCLEPCCSTPVMAWLAAAAVWLCFRVMLVKYRLFCRKAS